MLLADFWDRVGDSIIGAIPILLGILWIWADQRRRAREQKLRIEEVKVAAIEAAALAQQAAESAAKKAEVSSKKVDTVIATTKEHDAKLESISVDIREVRDSTNGMKDALVIATAKEALARGIKAGQEIEKQVQEETEKNPLPKKESG